MFATKTQLRTTFASLLACSLAACAPMHASLTEADLLKKKGDEVVPAPGDASDKLHCLDDMPDYQLDASIQTFEFVSSTGARFGFNALKFLDFLGLNLEAKSGQLAMGMRMHDPLRGDLLGVSVGKAISKEIRFGVEATVSMLGAGFESYSKTPISDLSMAAVEDTLINLTEAIKPTKTGWSTRVKHVFDDGDFLIPAGRLAGIHRDDEFEVYNVDYKWKGEPCASELDVARRLSTVPVAILKVKQRDAHKSVLSIKSHMSELPIKKGALIVISKRAEGTPDDPVLPLKKSVRFGELVSGRLVFEGGKEIDLKPYVSQQVRTIANKYNLYFKD